MSVRPSPLHRGFWCLFVGAALAAIGLAHLRSRLKPLLQKRKRHLRQGLPRSALPGSPPGRGEQVEEKPEGSPAGCRRVCGLYRDVLSANPGACSRSSRAWMPANRVLEGAFSLVTFFGQAKKVTRPPGMAGEARQGRTPGLRAASPKGKVKMDSGLRRNDAEPVTSNQAPCPASQRPPPQATTPPHSPRNPAPDA